MYLGYFSSDYLSARDKFLNACARTGAEITSLRHPERGPENNPLWVDVAVFGPRCADRLAIVISGTHGVEGFAGSACQTSWIHTGGPANLPRNCRVLMIHMLNPYGAAWRRRETEDNVDLNRNFLDHDRAYPENPAYDDLAAVFELRQIVGPARVEADRKMSVYIAEHGESAFIEALSAGQYKHPQGLYFGGTQPTWSRATLESVLAQFATKHEHVTVIDIHTGLGPYGYGTLMTFSTPVDPEYVRANTMFGPWLVAPLVEPTFVTKLHGLAVNGFREVLGRDNLTFLVLEFGTYDIFQDIERHREENWYWRHGDGYGDAARKIRAAHLEQAYPCDPDWREAIAFRFQLVIARTLNKLGDF